VCGDKPQARFGEGGTGDPATGDRPLLYMGVSDVSFSVSKPPLQTMADQRAQHLWDRIQKDAAHTGYMIWLAMY
jgi:hypothetical protein